jgi:hypothetical protein
MRKTACFYSVLFDFSFEAPAVTPTKPGMPSISVEALPAEADAKEAIATDYGKFLLVSLIPTIIL